MAESLTLSEAKRKLLEKLHRGGAHTSASRIKRRPLGMPAPLSLGQEQIWLRTRAGTVLPAAYTESIAIHRYGPLDVRALERCFAEILRRHEAWRTTFETRGGRPVQVIHPAPLGGLQFADLRGLPETDREEEALRLAKDQAQEVFDLERGPLVRALLITLDDEIHRLCLTMHQSIVDGVSVYQVVPQEVIAIYEAFVAGKPSPLPELPIQFADFAYWERAWLQGKVLENQLAYWSKRLRGDLPVLSWPADRPRPPVQTFRGAIRPFSLPEELRALLNEVSRREGVTLFMALVAGFAALLYRYTQQEDIIIGTVAPAGRKRPETQALLGYLLNAVALRMNVSGPMTFRALLAQTRQVVSEALSHDDVPFEAVVERLKPKPDPSRHPVFQLVLSLAPPMPDLAPGWDQTFMDVESGGAKWDLYLELSERQQGLMGRAQYNPDVFEPETLGRMLGHWETLLNAMAAHPDQPIGSAPILTDAERHQVLVEWNKTESDYPRDAPLHELIEAQVERTHHTVAIAYEERRMSYRRLDARANQLAQYLRKLGAGPGALVGVCVSRSPELVIALLGVLKSGAAYVPLDPDYPAGRLSFMVDDSRLTALVTQRALRPKFSEYRGKLVCLDADRAAIARESIESEPAGATADDLAYVIYTSGSTGKPKGVEITHRSLVNFLVSMQSRPGFTCLDTLVAVTTVSFDIAGLELYLPLISGGRLVLVSRDTAMDGYRLREILTRVAPTVMQATPATWRLLIEAGWHGSESLTILCGGEAMPRELARELLKRGSSLWNMYGPTETTIWSTAARITSGDGPITIGRPIANTQIYVLDTRLQPVPAGVPGELYIGGHGVARGYLHRAQLTAERFIPNPFGVPGSGDRLYRTGDLARYRPNGEVECLGRTDHQVKVRGFRIELGEIESVLAQHPRVRHNVVWTQEDESGEKQLAAYVVAAPAGPPSVKELREFLKQRLPDYMVPSRFKFMKSLPLTPNGKVDRRALPSADLQETTAEGERAAPRDAVERQLVEIWEQVLRVRPIGVEDNFFDVGGHSLLVAKLIRRVEDRFGKQLSMAAIFDAPTVEQQAALVRNGNLISHSSPILRIQPTGSRPPLFLFSFNAGPVFLPLARRLGSNQPLLCVGLTPQEASELPVPYKMEDLAVRLIKHVRETQPKGPYYFGGLCAGGLMAYEVASQLVAQGEEVALLSLFEPQAPFSDRESNVFEFRFLPQRLNFHRKNLRKLKPEEVPDYVRHRAKSLLLRLRHLAWRGVYGVRSRLNHGSLANLHQILVLAVSAYRPRPYAGRVALFQAVHRGDWNLQFSWHRLAANLEMYQVPGYHDAILLEPNVDALADKLGACLAEAQQVRR